jgi:phosphatidylglycerol lysyltransferase
MKIHILLSLSNLKEERFSFIRENGKLIGQFILAVFFIAVGFWFFKHEHAELGEVRKVLSDSKWQFLTLGFGITVLYIILQGLMYKTAFASVHSKVPLLMTIILYLKRNFISIFLPAGGVASLAFFTSDFEKYGISKTKIHFASSVYAFIGVLSVVSVAFPVFIYALIVGFAGKADWVALAVMILLIFSIFLLYQSIFKKGWLYRLILRISPAAEVFLEELISHSIDNKQFIFTIVVSIIIDLLGIVQVYIAMLALNFNPSLISAMMAYLASVIFLVVSPFMRGLGAVEVSMAYILTRFGFSSIEAVAITFLYRFFEFWLPLLSGVLSFFSKINKLLMRVVPALLIFALGIINIVSVLTPAVAERLQRLQDFIPVDAITASNYFVMVAGGFMLLTAAFLLKGLRSAWWIALFLSIISCIGHMTKAIDYEEATVALIVVIMLLFSKNEYYIKGSPRLRFVGISNAMVSIFAVLVYGTIGFYFLDKKYFDINFNLIQSIRYTIQCFFLVGSEDLLSTHTFVKHFLLSINVSGLLSLSFLFYTIISPFVIKKFSTPETLENAKLLVKKFGTSSMDYFKTYNDKMIFIPSEIEAFIAYRIKGNFAVVLENPVAENPEQMKICLQLFDKYCYETSLKSIYYRVPEESLPLYKESGKKSLFLGQEGIVDLNIFSLEGGSKKALRNSVNKVIDRGFKSTIHTPPIKDGVLQKLKAVSDEWLKDTERHEIIFSQGMFIWEELKQQTIVTVENTEEKIVGFLNIIPDHAPGEATYDLIRKTTDAPGGVMDFILIELFKYLKTNNYQTVNLGFAPMSGIESPQNLTEKSMRFAYQKIRSFAHYRGLRDFKEKFATSWFNKYLIYEHDFDLLRVPGILSKVIKPDHE